jgi:hypothetical protein
MSQLNGDLVKDFRKILVLKMGFGQFGIEIDPGKLIVDDLISLNKLMDINQFT